MPEKDSLLGTRPLPAWALGLMLLVIARVILAWIWPVPLSVDEAQYVAWSRELQFGYYSKPPLIAWSLSVATLACPTPPIGATFGPEGCARWLQPLALGGAAFFVYCTARALFHRIQVGMWAAILFLIAPLSTFYSQAATTDAWLLLWWSASLWAFVRAITPPRAPDCAPVTDNRSIISFSQRKMAWWAACGIFAGLGLLTKYSMAVFAVSALFVLLQRRLLLTSGPWMALLIATLVFCPNLIWNAQWDWPTISHHADITLGQNNGLQLAGFLNFFVSQWLVFSPLVFGAFLWISLRRIDFCLRPQSLLMRKPSRAIGLLMIFTWPMLLVVITQSLFGRAHANWASPALIGISLTVSAWWLTQGSGRRIQSTRYALFGIRGSLLINLFFCAVLLASPWLVKGSTFSGHRSVDPFVRLTGYKDVATAVAKLSPMPILASDDRKLLASLSAYLPQARVYAFNPTNLKDNHWQLQRDIREISKIGPPKAGEFILLIQRRDSSSQFADSTDGLGQFSEKSSVIGSTSNQIPSHLTEALENIRLEGTSNVGVRATWIADL